MSGLWMSGAGDAIAQITLLSEGDRLNPTLPVFPPDNPSPSTTDVNDAGSLTEPLPVGETSGTEEEASNDGAVSDKPEERFTPALSPQYPPPQLDWIRPGVVPPTDIITSSTISLSGLTPPSLWWTDQQFGGKTLKGWVAYPGTETLPPRVDLVVNRQLWACPIIWTATALSTIFGRAAQSFGYTIRVFNDIGEPLAIYPCPITPCAVILNSSGIGVLRDNSPF